MTDTQTRPAKPAAWLSFADLTTEQTRLIGMVAAYRRQYATGPTWRELGRGLHLAEPYNRGPLPAALRSLRRGGWLFFTYEPRSIDLGPAARAHLRAKR